MYFFQVSLDGPSKVIYQSHCAKFMVLARTSVGENGFAIAR
jgi:hypothetical protein